MAFLVAMTMTVGAMSATANAADQTESTSFENRIRGEFEGGASYACTPNGQLRINNDSFTPDEFYKLVEEYSPKTLWLIDSDISADENETIEWLKKITSGVGRFDFKGIVIVCRSNSSIRDKYNKMIDEMTEQAKANGENITETDLRFKYKMFFYEIPAAKLSGPDGVICENCHYIDITQMSAYPNNKAILAAVEAPNNIKGEVETLTDGVEVLAKIEQIGDANNDGTVNVRDCALIASSIANGKADSLPDTADYNKDGKKNVRDAAAISKDLASK